jgi:hypothetical protein
LPIAHLVIAARLHRAWDLTDGSDLRKEFLLRQGSITDGSRLGGSFDRIFGKKNVSSFSAVACYNFMFRLEAE